MEKILFYNSIYEIVITCVTIAISVYYITRFFSRPKDVDDTNSKENTAEKNELKININSLLIIIVFMIWIIIMLLPVTKNNVTIRIVGKVIAVIFLVKSVLSIMVNVAEGIDVVHKEIEQTDSTNFSFSGKIMLLVISLAITYIMFQTHIYLIKYVDKIDTYIQLEEMIKILIVIIWYLLLSFQLLCLVGMVTEVVFSIVRENKKEKKISSKSFSFDSFDSSKLLVLIIKKINSIKYPIIRYLAYIAIPIVILMCLILCMVIIVLSAIETIFKYVGGLLHYLVKVVVAKITCVEELGDKQYVWFCFRLSIVIAVITTVCVFIKYSVLRDTTLRIVVFVAESLLIPIIINELMRVREVFGKKSKD